MMRTTLNMLMVLALAAGLASCTTVRGWFGGGSGDVVTVEDTEVASANPAEARDALRESVSEYVQESEANAAGAKQRVIRKKPFFLKEYSDYPDDATNIMTIELVETESRTAPYRAEVTLPKVRYATQLHRSRDAARTDDDFIRQAGRETLSFSLRSGRWHPLGSAFVAESTEASTGGVWRETIIEDAEAEPRQEKGWFSRQWSKIFGG